MSARLDACRHASVTGLASRACSLLAFTMSDHPIVFKRTKSKATPRARVTDVPSTETALQDASSVGDAEPEPSPAALAAKVKNKAKQRNKPRKNLSFGADEEVCVSNSTQLAVIDETVGRRWRSFQDQEVGVEQEAQLGPAPGYHAVRTLTIVLSSVIHVIYPGRYPLTYNRLISRMLALFTTQSTCPSYAPARQADPVPSKTKT